MIKRTDETPEKICGGRVLEIGGLDQVFVRGAGVERILHTVRMAVITQAGASGTIVDSWVSLIRVTVAFLADFVGLSRRLAVLILRFNGVGFDGVFCSPRGVSAIALEGVFLTIAPFVGVVGAEPARDGVPGTEALADRLILAELAASDRSRYE